MPNYTITVVVPDADTANKIGDAFAARYGDNYPIGTAKPEVVRLAVRDFLHDATMAQLTSEAEAAALANLPEIKISVT